MSKRAIIDVEIKGEGKKRIPLYLDFSSGVAQPATATAAGSSPVSDPASLSADPQTFAGVTNFSKAVNTSQGADIASASTINLDTATGNVVDVTGTTGITAITLSQGRIRVVRFTGALTLTNGASLVLPGGADITTVAGDYAIFAGYASSVVRCVGYFRNGVPYSEGSFTITLTGFASPPTGTAKWRRYGNIVLLDVPALSGTSNAATCTLTGIPAAIRPATTQTNNVTILRDNGTFAFGYCDILTDGTANLFKSATATGSDWTTSGTKAHPQHTYSYIAA